MLNLITNRQFLKELQRLLESMFFMGIATLTNTLHAMEALTDQRSCSGLGLRREDLEEELVECKRTIEV